MENLNLEARIHSIETFGTVDGPGIRYVIFMQGCPLKCKYCHNRDTWDVNSGRLTTIEEQLERIKRYASYIKFSGGGITVSGGEPLLQPKFITALFKELHKQGIHTALDTSGSIPINDDIKELLENTDLVLLDIKHINNEKCIELTGTPNKNTIDFANYLKENNIPMWIRQVIVPGITDDMDDLLKLKEFVSNFNNIEKMEFLPYHELGKFKWEELGFKYPLDGVLPPSKEHMKEIRNMFKRNNW